ncbi:MAG: RNA polymerase sigma factor [Pyrinomonadaceae bacterium]
MPVKETDAQLLGRAAGGDEAAFLLLYRLHRDTLFRFAYRMLGSVEVAEDVTQDCFLSVLKQPERFDETRASLRTYLCAAARNLALKHFRGLGRETALEDVPAETIVMASVPDEPLRRVIKAELIEKVRGAIENLPPLQREALILFEYEEFTLAEIAAIAGADMGTIKARLYRARQSLRRTLAPYLKVSEAAALEKR